MTKPKNAPVPDLFETLRELDLDNTNILCYGNGRKRLLSADTDAETLLEQNGDELEPGRYQIYLSPANRTRDSRRAWKAELGTRRARYWWHVAGEAREATPAERTSRTGSVSQSATPNVAAVARPSSRAELPDEKAAREATARAMRARAELDAAKAEADLERMRAGSQSPVTQLADLLRVRPESVPQASGGAAIVAALAPIAQQMMAAWQAQAQASAARTDALLLKVVELRSAPVQVMDERPAGTPAADLLSQVKVFRDLLGLVRDLDGGGGGSEETSETGKLIDLVGTLFAKSQAEPKQVAQPVRRMPGPIDPGAISRQRVSQFLGALVVELENGSEPEAAAEVLEQAYGLLPADIRAALAATSLDALRASIAKHLGTDLQLKFFARVAEKPGGLDWMSAFVEALLGGDDEEDDEPEDQLDEPADEPIKPEAADGAAAG